MNLQELAKKHNLKAGDKVLCTHSTDKDLDWPFIEISKGFNSSARGGAQGGGCKFELPITKRKKRHIHADLINWWAECPSENEIQVKAINSDWVTVTSPSWYAGYEYRKKPTATELKINELFDSSIDALHGIANEINELTG